MGWQYTIPSSSMVFTKRAFQSAPLTQNNSYGALSFQMRARIPHFYSVRILRSRFNLVHRKTRRTEHERVGKTPIHLRCEKYPHGTNRSPSLLRQKGTPRNRAPLCILSLNFTSFLAFIRILLFPCFQFLSPFFAGV